MRHSRSRARDSGYAVGHKASATAMARLVVKPKQRLAVKLASPTCWLCAGMIDLTLRHPHPQSYSADHVLPKSLFGEGQTKPAHLVCNQMKGTKVVRPTPRGRVIAKVITESSQRRRARLTPGL